MKKAPKIRFDGYTEDWEQRKLSECAEFSKGNGYSKSDLTDTGIPIILYGRLYTKYETTIGEIDTFAEPKVGAVYSKGGEVIIPASGETAEDIARAATVENAGVLLGGDLNIITPNSDINSAFLALSISNGEAQKELAKKAQGKSVVHIRNAEIKGLNIFFPSKAEQTEIAVYYDSLDNLITLHQKECEKMLDFKEYMLSKMFPREDFSVPEIRFNGFDGAWSKRRFGELVAKFEDPVETPTGGYMRLGIRSHAKGTFHSYVKEGEGLETAKMFRVAPNKFIVNITFGWEHAVAITDEHDAGKLVSHRFPQYSFKEGMRPDFFKWIILDKRFKYHLGVSSPGGAGRNRVLNLESMLEYEMFVPPLKEQQAIGQYFRKLDELILLHQREVEAYKKMKQYMLRNMFV